MVVVLLLLADPASCKACSFLKYASRNDDVVIGLAVVGVGLADVADVAGVAGVADFCAALVAAVGVVGNLRFCRSIASLL